MKCNRTIPMVLSYMVFAAGCGQPGSELRTGGLDEEAAPETQLEEVPVEREREPELFVVPEVVIQESIEEADFEALPASLHCVSELGQSRDDMEHTVLRVTLSGERAGGRQLTVSSGSMFRVHGESVRDDTELADQAVQMSIDSDGLLQVVSSAKGGAAFGGESAFSATLTKQGPFFFGTLTEDACYFRRDSALTCWDPGEIFGSSWGAQPALSARFNWSKGQCTDANGVPALNEIPIEFLRETGFGVCADLRGANLNGRDYAYPELSWWNLQGADLQGAQLFFAKLSGANLHGAKMAGLEFGYASIGGSLDEFTELPDGDCVVTNSSWGGSTVLCSR